MTKYKLFLLGIFTLMFTSCSNSVYYTAETLPNTKIEKGKIIKVYVPDTATIEEKKMKVLIENKLVENGYKIDNEYAFNYILIFKLTEESFTSTKVETDYVPTTQYSTGYVNGKYTTTSTLTQVPDTTSRTVINMYKKNYFKLGDGSRNEVWVGFMSVDKYKYDANTENMINGMIGLIGKDYKGYLDIEIK